MTFYLFVFGASASVGQGFYITPNEATLQVGLLWTRDWLVAEISTWQNAALTTDRHPSLGGIQSHNLSRREAADLLLRPRSRFSRDDVLNYIIFSMSLLPRSLKCDFFKGQEKEIWYSLRTTLQCQLMLCCSINKFSDPFKNVNCTLVTTVLVIVQSLRVRDRGRFGTWNCSFLQVKWANQRIYSDESFRNSITVFFFMFCWPCISVYIYICTQYIVVINQLDAQNLFYNKFISCL